MNSKILQTRMVKFLKTLSLTTYVVIQTTNPLSADNSGLTKDVTENVKSNLNLVPNFENYNLDSNINFFFNNRAELTLGLNTIKITDSNYERIVKLQFSSGDIEFDSLLVNDEEILDEVATDDETVNKKVSESKFFIKTPSDVFPFELKVVDFEDFNSEYEQTITINITSLPAGAKRRVAISIPDIKSFYGGAGVPASTVGGSTRSGGGEIPAGNTNFTETGSTYN